VPSTGELSRAAGLRVIDLAALVFALPVAHAVYPYLSFAHASAIDTEAYWPALVAALVVWTASAWIHQLYEHPVARSTTSEIFRTLRVLATVALVLTALALVLTWLGFYARFDGWSGLWSAPGPRYLFFLVPLLLLPLGLWLRAPDARRTRRVRLAALLVLVVAGAFVQTVSTIVRWGSVPGLAGYPVLSPDQADFLFHVSSSPVVVMTRLLASGGPIDSWLWNLWHGWPGFPGQPGAVIALLLAWAAAVAGCATGLHRALRRERERVA